MEKTIIEINGVKMEVDLRSAKVVNNYKVGDSIKVLKKGAYSDGFESFIGTIIGFDNFEKHPTVVIAYLKTSYGTATIEFVYFNSSTKDVEICPLNDWDLPVSKQQVLDRFNSEIKSKEKEVAELQQKQLLFEKLFGKYFENEFSKAGVSQS